MFKHLLAATALVLGLAFVQTTSAQCGPNEVFFINHTDCPKDVTINYGKPCTVFGSVTMSVGCCGAFVCIPIPAGFIPITYDVFDPGSGNTGSVIIPDCGGQQNDLYMDCNGMCNMVQWADYFHVENLPD